MSDYEPLDEFHVDILSACIAADVWDVGFSVAGYADAWDVKAGDVEKALAVLRERRAVVGFRKINWSGITQDDLRAVAEAQHYGFVDRLAEVFDRFAQAQPGVFDGWDAEVEFTADDVGPLQ